METGRWKAGNQEVVSRTPPRGRADEGLAEGNGNSKAGEEIDAQERSKGKLPGYGDYPGLGSREPFRGSTPKEAAEQASELVGRGAHSALGRSSPRCPGALLSQEPSRSWEPGESIQRGSTMGRPLEGSWGRWKA